MRASALAVAAIAWLAVGCGPEPVSDTGYAGTWTRGGARMKSTVSIVPDGGGYRFRVGIVTDDDSFEVRCDWDGRCDELAKGHKVREHRYRPRVDPESGHLVVDCEIRGAEDGALEQSYTDELVVEPGGLVMNAFTTRLDGEPIPPRKGPKRRFRKVSDRVASPPEPDAG